MFERLMARTAARAEQAAERRAADLAKRLQQELPSGIEAKAEHEGVTLSGRGIGRRFALEPALRWLIGSMR